MSQHIGAIDPGWYPDPHGEPRDRYWDGHAWTDQTRPMRITITTPPRPAKPKGTAVDPESSD